MRSILSISTRAVIRRWRNLHQTHANTIHHHHRPRIGCRWLFTTEYGQRILQQRCNISTSSTVSSSSPDPFHGLSLPQEKDDSQKQRGTRIQEAEVVKSEQDKSKTRELIKEVTRAEMSVHSIVSNGDGGTRTAGKAAEDKEARATGPYERRLQQLNEAQCHHENIDRQHQTLEYAQSCIDMGELYYQLGDMDRSQKLYTDILPDLLLLCSDDANAESMSVQMMIAQSMHGLGAVHARCGEYEEASRWYEESLKRKHEIIANGSNSDDVDIFGDDGSSAVMLYRYELGKTYNGLAALEVMKGGDVQCEKAMSLFRAAERYFLYRRDPEKTTRHGNGDCNENNPLQAMEASLTCISKEDIQKMTPRHVESIINVRSNMGELLRQRGKYEDSVDIFRIALDTARMALENNYEKADATSEIDTIAASPIENSSLEEQGHTIVDLLVKIADNLISAKKFDEAAEAYEQALTSHVFFRRRCSEGNGARQEHTNRAAATALRVMTSTTKIKFDLATATTMEAAIRNNLAHALAQIGQDNLSLEHYTSSLAIKRHIGGDSHVEVAHTLMSMGALLGGPLRDFAKALNCFKEASHVYRITLEELNRIPEGSDSHSDTTGRSYFDDEDSAEIDRHIKNAMKNISMIEAALLKDRDGMSE